MPVVERSRAACPGGRPEIVGRARPDPVHVDRVENHAAARGGARLDDVEHLAVETRDGGGRDAKRQREGELDRGRLPRRVARAAGIRVRDRDHVDGGRRARLIDGEVDDVAATPGRDIEAVLRGRSEDRSDTRRWTGSNRDGCPMPAAVSAGSARRRSSSQSMRVSRAVRLARARSICACFEAVRQFLGMFASRSGPNRLAITRP